MPTPITTFSKDPNSTLDYGFRWGTWLSSGESLTCSTWTADNSGINTSSVTTTTSVSSVWISGGTVGQTYTLTNRVWTDNSPQRITERSVAISIVNK